MSVRTICPPKKEQPKENAYTRRRKGERNREPIQKNN